MNQGFSQLYEDYDTYQEGLPAISISYDHAYNRENARNYALKYALTRNPSWTRYDAWGGNCQNYGSQCIFAGGVPMDYTGAHSGSITAPRSMGLKRLRGEAPPGRGLASFMLMPAQILAPEWWRLWTTITLARNREILFSSATMVPGRTSVVVIRM